MLLNYPRVHGEVVCVCWGFLGFFFKHEFPTGFLIFAFRYCQALERSPHARKPPCLEFSALL